MASYNPDTQSPASINTAERNLLHAAQLLKSINQIAQVQVLPNSQADRQVIVNTFQADDQKHYAYVQAYIPLASDWESAGKPLWEKAEEVNNAAIPARFLRA